MANNQTDQSGKGESKDKITEHQLSYEGVFQKFKPELTTTLSLALQTPYGAKYLPTDLTNFSYETFQQKIPILTLEYHNCDSRLFIPENQHEQINKMQRVLSGSSMGVAKETYYDSESTLKLSEDMMKRLRKSKSILTLHENKPALSYKIIDDFFLRNFPESDIKTFDSAESFLEVLKPNTDKSVYMTFQVSSIRKLLYELKDLLEVNPNLIKGIKAQQVFIDLVAEPIEMSELKEIYDFFSRIFGCAPTIAVPYALSEFKLVGLYIYNPGDETFKYKITDDVFVECFDSKTGEPVIGKEGRIIITPLKKNKGSIYPRYDTGDIGKIEIGAQGERFFIGPIKSNLGRGQINLHADKIYAPGIFERIKKLIEFPIQMEFRIFENQQKSKVRLEIICYSNLFLKDIDKKKLMLSIIPNFLQEEFDFFDLRPIISKEGGLKNPKGDLEIFVKTSGTVPDSIIKSWKVTPGSQLEAYEQESLKRQLIKLVEQYSSVLQVSQNISADLLSFRKNLVEIISGQEFLDIDNEWYKRDDIQKIISRIRDINDIFEKEDEKEYSQGLTFGKFSLDQTLSTYGITETIASQEAKAASIDSSSKVAFIGGGSLPLSAYLYAKATGCEVTIFDKDSKSIKNAEEFIKLVGFSNKIKVKEADGISINFGEYTHVITAAMVDDKEAVLKKIVETGKKGLMVICRSTEGIQQLIYSPVKKIPSELSMQEKIFETTTTTYLFKYI